jgi:hypothetical protein
MIALPQLEKQKKTCNKLTISLGLGCVRKKDLKKKLGDIPTMPKSTQYTAANIVNGIDAKSAPNFPLYTDCQKPTKDVLQNLYFKLKKKPNMEKKIMKPAEICMTLLLPTLVEPRRPTFSLY